MAYLLKFNSKSEYSVIREVRNLPLLGAPILSQASINLDWDRQAFSLPMILLPITVLARWWQGVAENAATVSTARGQIQNPLL